MFLKLAIKYVVVMESCGLMMWLRRKNLLIKCSLMVVFNDDDDDGPSLFDNMLMPTSTKCY